MKQIWYKIKFLLHTATACLKIFDSVKTAKSFANIFPNLRPFQTYFFRIHNFLSLDKNDTSKERTMRLAKLCVAYYRPILYLYRRSDANKAAVIAKHTDSEFCIKRITEVTLNKNNKKKNEKIYDNMLIARKVVV